MASLFYALGHEMGNDFIIENPRNTKDMQVRGLEHRPLKEMLDRWETRLFTGVGVTLLMDDPKVADTLRPEVARIRTTLPKVVKNPQMLRWLGLWLLAGGTKPDTTVVMMRDTRDQARSNIRDGFSPQTDLAVLRADVMLGYGFLIETIVRHDLPWVPMKFPLCVQDARYTAKALSIPDHQRRAFYQVHQQVAKPQSILT